LAALPQSNAIWKQQQAKTQTHKQVLYLSCGILVSSSAVGGSDYTIRPNSTASKVTFADGSATADCSINITDDDIQEPEEVFEVRVATTGRGWLTANDTTTITIVDNEGRFECSIKLL